MTTERSQLYYTSIFLHVSFQAVQKSVVSKPGGDDTPCWLDAQMLRMLYDELQRCRLQASPFKDVCGSLDTAIYHCGLLMAQCPAALNRQLCQHHLEAIMAPLQQASLLLSRRQAANRPASPSQRLRHWLGWSHR